MSMIVAGGAMDAAVQFAQECRIVIWPLARGPVERGHFPGSPGWMPSDGSVGQGPVAILPDASVVWPGKHHRSPWRDRPRPPALCAANGQPRDGASHEGHGDDADPGTLSQPAIGYGRREHGVGEAEQPAGSQESDKQDT